MQLFDDFVVEKGAHGLGMRYTDGCEGLEALIAWSYLVASIISAGSRGSLGADGDGGANAPLRGALQQLLDQ